MKVTAMSMPDLTKSVCSGLDNVEENKINFTSPNEMEITSIFPLVVHTPAITGICGSLIIHGQCTLCLKNFYYHSFQLYVVENYTAGHNHGISCSPEIGCTLPPKIHEPTAQCEHVSHQQRSAEPNRRKQLLLELHCAG